LDIHVYHPIEHDDRIGQILIIVKNILLKERKMSQELDDLIAEVAETRNVEEAAVIAINGLIAKLDEALASNDPAKIAQATADLKASAAALAAAIPANTV
jgi:hypothetical protein